MSGRPRHVDRERPWPALAAFREDDEDFFGGRDEEVEGLYRRIVAGRLTLLFGLSGLGKTSLLRAGLFPRLRGERYFPVYVRLRYGPELPSPVEQIQAEIAAQAKEWGVDAPEARAGETLWEYFHRPEADFWDERNNPCTPVLVFDQFEELFTKSREVPAAAKEVVEELANLSEGASRELLSKATAVDRALLQQVWDGRYRLLISIRSDYLAQLQGISDRMRAIFANRYELRRMNGPAALRSTLKAGAHLMDEPVARRVVRFVAGAAETADLVPAVEEMEVEPALLSLVCSELNAARLQRGEAKITASMLSGSKDEILSRFYESSFADLAPELRELVEDKLVTRDGRSRNFISEQTARETPGVTEDDLGKLVHRRLLRFEESGSSRRLELTHDLLAGVAAASRSTREQRRQLEEAERARADAEAREASARKKLRRSRAALLLFLVLLAVAVAGPFVAAHWTAVGAKKVEADSAFRLALQKLSSDEPAEGLAYLARVIRLDRGNSAARTLLYEQLVTRSWPVPIRSFGPPGRIEGAVFNQDGTRVALNVGNTVEMWDVARGERIAAIDGSFDPDYTRFAADGWTVLSRFSGLQLWNPRAGRSLQAHLDELLGPGRCSVEVHDLSTNGEDLAIDSCGLAIVHLRGERPMERPLQYGFDSARFLPDSRFLLVARTSRERDVLLIDRQATGAAPKSIPDVDSLWDLSSDGSTLAIGRDEMDVETWDLKGWTSAGERFNNQSKPRSAIFEPAGRWIMTMAEDDGIRLWDSVDGQRVFKPLWHPQVKVAAFSTDGARILTASDRLARWWNAHDGESLAAPVVQPKMLTAHFDHRGNIVTVSTRAQVWDLATSILPPLLPPETVVRRLSPDRKTAFSDMAGPRAVYDTASGKLLWKPPDEVSGQVDPQLSHFLVASGDNMSLVDAKGGKPLWTLRVDFDSVEFSDDGTALQIYVRQSDESKPHPLLILSAATGKPLAPPLERHASLDGKSRDASLLALRSGDKLEIWNVRQRRAVLTIPVSGLVTMAFSRDGRQLATVSPPEGLRIWDIATGEVQSAKRNQSEELLVPAFSPDGRRLAVTTETGVVLCAAQTLRCEDEPLAHPGATTVDFSADGGRIMTAADEDLRVWDADTGQPLSLSLPRSPDSPAGLTPDGASVFGAENWALYRVPLPSIDDADAERLATIAEALAGVRIDRLGVSEAVDGIQALADLEAQCEGVESRACAIVRWLRTPAAKRTISPLSNVSVADYLERTVYDWWWAKALFPSEPGLGTKPPE